MERTIVISALLNQIQVGLVENGRLAEYYLERGQGERLVGNIYEGRVENILPGMGAAFVDIGLDRNAFLLLADLPSQEEQQNLKVGQSLLVQVSKEATGTKGPRITTDLLLPGRYLVLLPGKQHIGISRQIEDEDERERLKELARELRPDNCGLIVRTVAEGCNQEELREDLDDLVATWALIGQKRQRKINTRLLYHDHDLIHRVLRDFYSSGMTKIIVDRPDLLEQVKDELESWGIQAGVAVQLYQGKVNLFAQLALEKDLERARQNRVWLDCGGYLVFNQTEALLSVDVNTGKYIGKQDLQETILKTNLQAAREIAHQLRLRNVGGIIIIDFIDMKETKNREAVLAEFADCLDQDKTRTNLVGFTGLGLVELTRKKSRRLLSQIFEVDCPHCQGRGRVLSDETVAFQVATAVNSLAQELKVEAIMIHCHSAVAAQIIGPKGVNLASLEEQTGKIIYVRGDDSKARDAYELQTGSIEEMKQAAYPVKVGDKLWLNILTGHATHKNNGLGKLEGFVIECLNAREFVGQRVQVEIIELHKTSAVARLID